MFWDWETKVEAGQPLAIVHAQNERSGEYCN